MKPKHKTLLLVDASVNLALGLLLVLSPLGLLGLLGLPQTDSYFYVTILGAVIFGIGVALMVELVGSRSRLRGVGLGGAIAINVCGGGALLGWLIVHPQALPLRGSILLWTVAIIVLGVAAAEILARSWTYEEE